MSNFPGHHTQPILALPANYPYQYSVDYYAFIHDHDTMIFDTMFSSPPLPLSPPSSPPLPYFSSRATNSNPLVLDEGLVFDEIQLLHHWLSSTVGADQQRASTGLSEEMIRTRLKTRRVKISAGDDADVAGEEMCVICQAEYGGDEIVLVGILDCGHRYHPECIKEWLLRQNCCPICKRKAIS